MNSGTHIKGWVGPRTALDILGEKPVAPPPPPKLPSCRLVSILTEPPRSFPYCYSCFFPSQYKRVRFFSTIHGCFPASDYFLIASAAVANAVSWCHPFQWRYADRPMQHITGRHIDCMPSIVVNTRRVWGVLTSWQKSSKLSEGKGMKVL
jgi:hypothetical protein